MSLNKISIKKLVEFRRYSKRRKSSFAHSLKAPKKGVIGGSGGNYWVRSVSAISKAFKENDPTIIQDRLDGLKMDLANTQRHPTKVLYQRNIEILEQYLGFDFSKWMPTEAIIIESLTRDQSILDEGGLPIQVRPSIIFSFEKDGISTYRGIWFITWLEGFKKEDLGMYAECIYRLLEHVFNEEYVDSTWCIAVDVGKNTLVRYSQVLDGTIPSLMGPTLDDLRKYL